MRCALALLTLTLPTLAAARPFTAGIGLGVSQSKVDGESGLDASRTLGLFGRIGLTERLSAQLELQRIDTEDGSGVNIRSGTGLLVMDLGRGSLVPTAMIGLGFAEADGSYTTTHGTHVEIGAGLEYRASGGLVFGGDLRIGSRSIDTTDQAYPLYEGDTRSGSIALYAPSYLSEGEYRSARLYVGVRF